MCRSGWNRREAVAARPDHPVRGKNHHTDDVGLMQMPISLNLYFINNNI